MKPNARLFVAGALLLPLPVLFAGEANGVKVFMPAWGHGICYEVDFDQQTYRLGTAMLDINPESGKVTLKGKMILFNPKDGNREQRCTLGNAKNPFYALGMQCNQGQYSQDYVDVASELAENSPTKFKNENVIYLGRKLARAKTALRVRAKPNMRGAVQSFCEFKEGHGSDICRGDDYTERDAMREGSSFTVVARTAEKSKVGKAEDYWYYITTFDGCSRAIEGWSFGEFIEITGNQPPQLCRFY